MGEPNLRLLLGFSLLLSACATAQPEPRLAAEGLSKASAPAPKAEICPSFASWDRTGSKLMASRQLLERRPATVFLFFASWCDKKEEILDTLLKTVSGRADDRGCLAALKQSWREAEAIVARQVKRGAEGLSEEQLDDPLPHSLKEQVEKTFSAYYS